MDKDIIKERLEAAKAAARAIDPQCFVISKLIYEFKSYVSIELSCIFDNSTSDTELQNMKLTSEELSRIEDLSENYSGTNHLLEDILKLGKKVVDDFNKKHSDFFSDKKNCLITNCNSTTNFVLSFLKEKLIIKVKALAQEEEAKIELELASKQDIAQSTIINTTSLPKDLAGITMDYLLPIKTREDKRKLTKEADDKSQEPNKRSKPSGSVSLASSSQVFKDDLTATKLS